MPNFFKSFFSGKSEPPESEKQKKKNNISKCLNFLYVYSTYSHKIRKVKNRKTTGKDSRSSNMTVCVHNVWDVRITQ